LLAGGGDAYGLVAAGCGGPVSGEVIRGGPVGGPLGGGGGVALAPGVKGPVGGPVLVGWLGNGEATVFKGVPRREDGLAGPKSGVSFQAGMLGRLAAGTIDGEFEKLRGGGASGCGVGAP
jgi:hypothetical protein